jgi:branched-subunit amino acid ABC-type transport system permease component
MQRVSTPPADVADEGDTAPDPDTSDRRALTGGRIAIIAVAVLLILAWLFEFVAESLVIGSTENAPLVLAALGFALLYRLTGLLNVAYAETVTLGGYFAIWLTSTTGLGFAAAVIPAGIMAGLLSVVTYLLVFRPAKKRNVEGLELIVMSFGLALFLRHALQFVFGFRAQFFDTPPPNTINIFGEGVSSFRLLAVASVAVLSFAIYQFIRRTSYGLQIRALASNPGLAEASGVQPLNVTLLIWFVAGFAGGLAGAFFGVASAVTPLLGTRQLLFILLVVLLGGIWDLLGVVWVGAATGIALTAMTLWFGSDLYAQLVLIVLFLALLKTRGNRLTSGSKV